MLLDEKEQPLDLAEYTEDRFFDQFDGLFVTTRARIKNSSNVTGTRSSTRPSDSRSTSGSRKRKLGEIDEIDGMDSSTARREEAIRRTRQRRFQIDFSAVREEMRRKESSKHVQNHVQHANRGEPEPEEHEHPGVNQYQEPEQNIRKTRETVAARANTFKAKSAGTAPKASSTRMTRSRAKATEATVSRVRTRSMAKPAVVTEAMMRQTG